MAKIVAFNYDYLRNACQFYAEKNKTNPSAIIKENHLSNSILTESLNTLSRNSNLFDFPRQAYLKYGAMYEDRFSQLCCLFELDKNDFIIQTVEKERPATPSNTKHDLSAIEKNIEQMANDIRDIGIVMLDILERLKDKDNEK